MVINVPRRGAGVYEPVSEINVTPLVDVMLVLLIIFMITAPMLAAGMRVNLPHARAAQPLEPKEPLIITVNKDGKTFLGRDEVTREQIAEATKARRGSDLERVIHVRGDREAMYGEIVAVMDELARNGLTKIALIANSSARRSGEPPVRVPTR